MIFKRIFSRQPKQTTTAPMRGGESQLTGVQQNAMRASMEAQVTADRKKRGATDVRPGETAPGK